MATCIKAQTVYTHSTSATNSALVASVVYVPDAVTPIASCGSMAISSVEYQDLQHGYITSREDADAVASALVLLLAIVFTYKAIRRSLDVDVAVSDEKH